MGWIMAGMVSLIPVGCSRYDHVQDADEHAYRLIAEKSDDPRWAQPCFAVELDPRSRYFDPYDHISPPMPPDDPASHRYMHRVDGKEHYSYWDQYGFRPDLENPGWELDLPEYVEVDEEGKILLGLEESVRLAIVHNPEYQEQFETVYLSALDVSTERFRFDTQFFGSFFAEYENRGPESGNVIRSPGQVARSGAFSSSVWDLDSSLVASRRLATAGELLVGFANNTVWELVGRNSNVSTSVLNFSFVQPLLRAGGRAFALEQLTIVERALLANLRALERYRQGFFTDIAIGNDGVQGPRRRGGFFGGTGLTGFTGQGSGGFGGVGAATGFGGGFGGGAGGTGGGAGTTGFAGGGAGNVGGFLGLLQRTQQIRNSELSLEQQLSVLELLEDNLAAGLIDAAQVAQFRQSIETERATLLQARVGYQDALDSFLVRTLGLPPDVPVEVDQTFIEPFKLIGDETLAAQSRANRLQTDFGRVFGAELAAPSRESISGYLDQINELIEETEAAAEVVREDLAILEQQVDERKETMTEEEQQEFEARRARWSNDLEVSLRELNQLKATVETIRESLPTETPENTGTAMVALIKDVQSVLGGLSVTQARARAEAITVDVVTLDSAKALDIARAHRLDWMNNRAALVDTWRLIQFNAQALRSNLTLRVDGDVSTLGGDNPFKFRGETGTIRASLQFDPPFTRLTERNNFRQQLIEYQQARRQLIQYEDGVHLTLRQLLRNLEQLEENLEIQRRAVNIAIDRVDQTREELNKPVPPPLPGDPLPFQPTATNNLTALSDLRNTQNNFLSVWLNYYASRMVLMRELGLMQIDENGMWIDEPLDLALAAALEHHCEPLPPDVPEDWLGPDPKTPLLLPAPGTDEPEDPGTDEPEDPAPAVEPMDDEKPRTADDPLPACRPARADEGRLTPANWVR